MNCCWFDFVLSEKIREVRTVEEERVYVRRQVSGVPGYAQVTPGDHSFIHVSPELSSRAQFNRFLCPE